MGDNIHSFRTSDGRSITTSGSSDACPSSSIFCLLAVCVCLCIQSSPWCCPARISSVFFSFFPPRRVPCKMVLASELCRQMWPNQFIFRLFTVVCSVYRLPHVDSTSWWTDLLIRRCWQEIPNILRRHFISKDWIRRSVSAVVVQLSQRYRKMKMAIGL